MLRLATFILFATVCQLSLNAAEGGFCRKCEVMKDYYKKNPSKYKYYEDYLKEVDEKGADSANPSAENLPPDVKFIMEQEKVGSQKVEKKKP
jgi:hypothetical protein